MRCSIGRGVCLAMVLAACGDDGGGAVTDAAVDTAIIDTAIVDTAIIDGPPVDAPIDAIELDACAPRILFAGGVDPVTQGWTVIRSGNAEITVPTPGVTQLRTQPIGGSVGSQLLLYLPGVFSAGPPFTVDVELQILAVAPHNQFDAAAAIMGSFTPSVGNPTDRGEMIYIDAARLGWADDSAQSAQAAIDGAFHTYRLAVDAAGLATVSRDGQPVLTRAGYVTNGNLAIGDQTNDVNLEATTQLRSVSIPCP